MLLMLRRCVVLLLFVVEISNTASTFEAAKQPQQEEDEAVILQQKVDIDFLPLAKDLLSKLQHVQIYIHHGRIIGNIVVERSTYSGENDEMRELLAYCDLEIVSVFSFLILPFSKFNSQIQFFFAVILPKSLTFWQHWQPKSTSLKKSTLSPCYPSYRVAMIYKFKDGLLQIS